MDPINQVPYIEGGIPIIKINGIPVNLQQIKEVGTRDVKNINVADMRIWMQNPPQSIPVVVPVTTFIGTPVVNIPGCVTVSKENTTRPEGNKNKQLPKDDPKGSMTLCDGGAPYFNPPEYDYRELTWQTVYQEQEQVDEGVDTGEPPAPDLDTPEPPPTGGDKQEDPDCPPPNARRIGDVNTAQTEKVSGYELQIDKNNPDGPKICVTLWEDIGTVEKFLPSVPVVSTTATIAAVATTSALLAKPLADLLLKVVKPIVKKVLTKVQTMIGQNPHRPTISEIRTNQYREKKGMLPINFGKKKKPLKKTDPPN